MKHNWTTSSSKETIECGRFIGKTLKPGSVIALEGDLGTGKTTLTKGIALGLGVKSEREVKSPTFVILHIYKGKVPLYHFDLYRLETESDLEGIGLHEFMSDKEGVSVIEWADRIPGLAKKCDLVVKLKNQGKDKREIICHSRESGNSENKKQVARSPRTRG